MRPGLLVAQVTTIGLGAAVDAVARVGFPIVSTLALGAWTMYQDRVTRAERGELEKAFRAEREADRSAHLEALTKLTGEVRSLRDDQLRGRTG